MKPTIVPLVVYTYIQDCINSDLSIFEAIDISAIPLDVLKWAKKDPEHEEIMMRGLLTDILIQPDPNDDPRYLVVIGARTQNNVRYVDTIMRHQDTILRVTKQKSRLLDHLNNRPFLFTIAEIESFDPSIKTSANLIPVNQDHRLEDQRDKYRYF